MKRLFLPILLLFICNLSIAQICNKSQLPFNLQNGLVGYYPFCGNANDGSGNGNNGVVTGATLTSDRFGNANSAYNFNGTSNYITIANVAANTFTSTFSISVWVKPSSGYGSGSSPNGNQNQIISKWGFGGVNNAAYALGVDQSGIAFTGVHNGSVSSSVNSSPSIVSINEWHHLVSTLSGGVLKLYVDNVLVKTISNSVNAQNSRYTLDIAREALGNYSYFKGVIDDIQLYNRALNACEVNQIYTSTNTSFITPSILTFNPMPTLISLCGTSVGLDAGSGFTSYLWNTGATSQTISATTSGEYRVTVTNAAGCSASDTINVSLVKADILQSDQTVCANTPLTLSVNSYQSQSSKTIDFDNVGLAALDVSSGTAGSVSGVSGNGLSISRPTEVKTKDQTYGYGDYEVDAKTGDNTSNQYLSVLLPLNSWTNEAISIDSRPSGTDDVGWGVYVNAVRVAFANGSNPASASNWYKMKIRVTPDSVKCWINNTLLYQGLNTTLPRNVGAVKLSTFSTSHFDNLKYTPYQTYTSVLWSTSATTSTISVTPTATTTYYATISNGISSCTDSVLITINNISGFNPLQDTVKVCGDSAVLDAGPGFASYNWSNGATTRTTSVKTSGKYFVTVVNASGCNASDTSLVSIVRAKIFQRDTTICKGSGIKLAIDSSFFERTVCSSIGLPNNLRNGLVGYWPFCGNANDQSGNNNHGQVNNAVLTTDRFGVPGSAYQFNNSFILIPNNVLFNSNNISVSMWISTTKSEKEVPIVRNNFNNASSEHFGIALNDNVNDKVLYAAKYNNPNCEPGLNWIKASSNQSLNDGKFHHIVGVINRDTIKLFVDGILKSSIIAPTSVTSSCWGGDIQLGRNWNSFLDYFEGKIDDVALWNRPLSAFEVQQMYLQSPSVSWSTGSISNTISVKPTSTTKYFVTVSDGITTCKDSITVTVSDIGSFNPLQDTVKVCGDSTILDAGANYASYNWSNGATTRTITAKASGKYFVTVANASGCSASDTSVVSIVKAKIIQRDTTICKGSSLTLAIDSSFSASITNCNISNLPANIKLGLVAYFPFCGNASDATTNSNNATVYGPTLTTDRFGFANSAYLFNQSGSNQYMSIGSSSSLNITGSLTLSFWFSPSTVNAGYIIDRDICNPNPDWSIRWEGGKIIARYGIVGQDFEISSNVIPLNTWNVVTVVRNSSNSKLYLYINGILSSSINYSGANFTNNLNNIYIGESLCNSSTNPNFSGKLDDIYIFNRALSSNEILQLNTTVSSVSWSNGATSNSINITPTSSTKFFVTVSDGITRCIDSITVTVSDIGAFNSLQDTVKVCEDSIVLDAGAGFASYNWSNGATTRIISAKTSGKYFVNVANASGCGASDTSVVSIINANIIQSDTTVCKGNNLTLQINLKPNQNATWSTGATTPSIVVNPTVKTTYKVTVTDGITTCTDSVIVDVSSSELKVNDPAAVCSPGVVNLTAAAVTAGSAAGLTYTYWKDANATQSLANPDKVSVSGTYYIVGTSTTGCTSAPTAVKVTVNPLPIAAIVTPLQTIICDKSTLTLTATGGTSYQWFYNGAVIAGATSSTFAASQAGSYEVNVIALGCTSKVAAPVNLSLITAAVPKFSNSSTCLDVPVSIFNETDTSTSGSVNWLWDFGDGQTSSIFNPVYTYKKSGAFNVKLTVTPKLCSSLSSSITKSITVDVPPVGIKYPNVLAVKNKATPLSARFIANGYSYLWLPSIGLSSAIIQKPVFNSSFEQLYRVRLTSPGGCISMDTVKVSVYDSSDIFVPKAFSPNKDGKNDILQPFLVNITTLKYFRIYNRWGQLMFQTSDSRQGWDGMYNYKPQPLETYTWIAEGIDGNGTTIFRKGQTVLIR